ncbi:MAG: hypothetical protein JW863_15045 [Chitinispirillaceae bacterium]|nr:hypothetical protein [Chitinispirillaceae bacterium]
MTAVAFDKSGTHWIGTGLGLKKYVNESWIDDTVITRFSPSPAGTARPEKRVTALCFNADGAAWIGTASGLLGFSGESGVWYDTTGGALSGPEVSCLADDRSGGVWVGTAYGLVHITTTGIVQFTTGYSLLLDNDITAVAIARNGDLRGGHPVGRIDAPAAADGGCRQRKNSCRPHRVTVCSFGAGPFTPRFPFQRQPAASRRCRAYRSVSERWIHHADMPVCFIHRNRVSLGRYRCRTTAGCRRNKSGGCRGRRKTIWPDQGTCSLSTALP